MKENGLLKSPSFSKFYHFSKTNEESPSACEYSLAQTQPSIENDGASTEVANLNGAALQFTHQESKQGQGTASKRIRQNRSGFKAAMELEKLKKLQGILSIENSNLKDRNNFLLENVKKEQRKGYTYVQKINHEMMKRNKLKEQRDLQKNRALQMQMIFEKLIELQRKIKKIQSE